MNFFKLLNFIIFYNNSDNIEKGVKCFILEFFFRKYCV